YCYFFFFSSRRRHTRSKRDWSSDVCSSDLQLKMAVDAGKLGTQTANHFNALFKQLKSIFPKAPPSLLHGDLWGGNYFYDEAGRAVLYDPAVYYGHREIELAFTHLFGGFSSEFYQSYTNEWPLDPGFSSRKDI